VEAMACRGFVASDGAAATSSAASRPIPSTTRAPSSAPLVLAVPSTESSACTPRACVARSNSTRRSELSRISRPPSGREKRATARVCRQPGPSPTSTSLLLLSEWRWKASGAPSRAKSVSRWRLAPVTRLIGLPSVTTGSGGASAEPLSRESHSLPCSRRLAEGRLRRGGRRETRGHDPENGQDGEPAGAASSRTSSHAGLRPGRCRSLIHARFPRGRARKHRAHIRRVDASLNTKAPGVRERCLDIASRRACRVPVR